MYIDPQLTKPLKKKKKNEATYLLAIFNGNHCCMELRATDSVGKCWEIDSCFWQWLKTRKINYLPTSRVSQQTFIHVIE